MKTINILCGALIVLAALMAPPALAASLLSASAGVILMASGVFPAAAPIQTVVQPAPVVQVVRIADPVRMFELDDGRGVVVFRTVDGKLTSRFYRA